ncbi:hypothetical protein [Streptomyces cellulosae]|uniref:hypothetical protein n=1 Tax=Streptomyces cellulosae TaxID=1968 RepID=UPI0004C56107|nr:hypothetical protein [Streptomyces cellulosae]
MVCIQEASEEAHLPWLLLVGRDVAIDDMVERHDEVEAIVVRQDGEHDYGEATYLAEKPIADPVLTGECNVGKDV